MTLLKSNSNPFFKYCKMVYIILLLLAKSKNLLRFQVHSFGRTAVILQKFTSELWMVPLVQSKPNPISHHPFVYTLPTSLQLLTTPN